MQGFSGSQPANMLHVGCALAVGQIREDDTCSARKRQGDTHRYMALTRMPTIRPNVAPTAIDGTKMPAGTLHPYDMMTRNVRMTVASRSELTMRH